MPNARIHQLLERYARRGWKLRTAESCTAGGIAARIGSVPGASAVLDRGWVVYSNEAKSEELGVAPELISEHGAVSHEVVQAMAEGGCGESTVCVAVSGIAGPDGGTPDKPVGTVWMAIAMRGCSMRVGKFEFSGSRAHIQQATVDRAIDRLLSYEP